MDTANSYMSPGAFSGCNVNVTISEPLETQILMAAANAMRTLRAYTVTDQGSLLSRSMNRQELEAALRCMTYSLDCLPDECQ